MINKFPPLLKYIIQQSTWKREGRWIPDEWFETRPITITFSEKK